MNRYYISFLLSLFSDNFDPKNILFYKYIYSKKFQIDLYSKPNLLNHCLSLDKTVTILFSFCLLYLCYYIMAKNKHLIAIITVILHMN